MAAPLPEQTLGAAPDLHTLQFLYQLGVAPPFLGQFVLDQDYLSQQPAYPLFRIEKTQEWEGFE